MNALILPTTELRLVDTDGMCCDTSQATSAFLRLLGFLDPAEAGRYGYRTPSPVAHNLVARCTHKPYSPPRTMRSLSHPLRKRSPAPLCGAGGTSAVALGAAGESARPFHLHHRSISRDAPGAQPSRTLQPQILLAPAYNVRSQTCRLVFPCRLHKHTHTQTHTHTHARARAATNSNPCPPPLTPTPLVRRAAPTSLAPLGAHPRSTRPLSPDSAVLVLRGSLGRYARWAPRTWPYWPKNTI